MSNNETLIKNFYESFQNKDHKGMQACYDDKATFSDEVFTGLNAEEVKAMWEMLIRGGKDLRLEFNNIKAGDKSGSAEWTAWYTFSKTGNKVVNHIRAEFTFSNGRILTHSDHFDFYRWSRQALGITGVLLGWTPFLKNKVRQTAKTNLENFMRNKATD